MRFGQKVLFFMFLCSDSGYLIAQSALERLKEMEVESVGLEFPSSFCFEITSIEFNGVFGEDEFKRFLGRRVRGGQHKTRVDVLCTITRGSKKFTTYEHSLVRSNDERFFAMGIEESPLQLLDIPKFAPNPGELHFVDPFQFVIFGTQVIGRRETPARIGKFLDGFKALNFDDIPPNRCYMMGRSNPVAVRFDFHPERSWMVLNTHMSVASLDPQYKKRKAAAFQNASELKDWIRMQSITVQWEEIAGTGWFPSLVSANSENYMPRYPKAMHQIECRFFDYEFDTDKIPDKLLEPESFTPLAIKKDFNVQALEKNLKKLVKN